MKRLANERKYVEDMIKSKTLNVNRPGKDINSLIKYLYEQNPKITKQELIELVNKFLLEIVQDEKAVKRWQVSIKEYVDNFMSYANNFKGLSHIESVKITEHELDMIMDLQDRKLEYVAFALLVYLKIKNKISDKQDPFVTTNDEDIKIIKKITGYKTLSTKQCALMINELQNRGYTKNGIGGAVSSKLVYVDYDSEDIIEIFDFTVDNIHLYYKAFINGDKIIHCRECGKITFVDNYKFNYCEECKREKQLEQQRVSMMKKRE